MSKIERGIQGTLLNKGKTLAAQAKRELTTLVSETKTIMTDDLEYQWRKLSNMLSKQATDTHNEASSLLDQIVMLLGEEMEMAHSEFHARLSDQNVKNRQIESIQKRVISATHPQIDELQATLVKEVNIETDEALQNAQDDLHLQQGRLTKTTDEKIRAHNQSMDANAAGLQADLRREAELIDHDV
jgi:polyhydroxyalkanoate synthesis regulator phasin